MQQQLDEDHKRIMNLVQQLQTPQIAGPPPTEGEHLKEELATLTTMLAQAQKASDTTEIEISQLRDELCQSFNREREIRAMVRKVV